MSIVDLAIDRLAYGGRGVGRVDGMAVFVADTAPGDRVLAQIRRQKKRFAEAELLKVLAPGAGRREPPCPVADRCGGCQWQHLTYSAQCRAKEEIFRDQLQRQAGIEPEVVQPLVPSMEEFAYRSRTQIKARWDRRLAFGFYATGSHDLVIFDQCPILVAALDGALPHIKQALSDWPGAHRIVGMDLNSGDDSALRALIHLQSAPLPEEISSLERVWEPELGALFLLPRGGEEPIPVCGDPWLKIHPLVDEGLELLYGPGGFAQIHLRQNQRLVQELLDTVGPLAGKDVLDLYCGMGNFSLPMASRGARVTGVELSEKAIEQARMNGLNNGLTCAKFMAQDVGQWLKAEGARRKFDLVVLDPPRCGAEEAVDPLLSMGPVHIAYISCDLATLTRDLKRFCASGYRVVSSRAFDLCPQTYHIESLTLLQKK